MPHMKYFQGVADIESHYANIVENYKSGHWGRSLLDTWDIKEKDKADILEEKDVLRYLIGCQLSLVRDSNVKKPTIEAVNRCFNRHLKFLEDVHNCHQWNVNKYPSLHIRKQYKACRHYLFKFSLRAWVDKLPDEILTYENKYGRGI